MRVIAYADPVVNQDQNGHCRALMGASGLPAVHYFREGFFLTAFTGLKRPSQLLNFLRQYFRSVA